MGARKIIRRSTSALLQERGRERRASLHEERADARAREAARGRRRASRRGSSAHAACSERRRVGGIGRPADDERRDCSRAVRTSARSSGSRAEVSNTTRRGGTRGAGDVAHGEQRIVRERGADADRHRVDAGAQPVHLARAPRAR